MTLHHRLNRYAALFLILISALSFATRETFADEANTSLIAPSGTADQFMNNIYIHYQGRPDTAKGIQLDTDTRIQQYFEPSLALLIINDNHAAKKRGVVPLLDGDPFVDSQEWSLSDLTIEVHPHDQTTADAIVQFTNYGHKLKLHFMLVDLPEGWRIANISSDRDETSLRELYRTK